MRFFSDQSQEFYRIFLEMQPILFIIFIIIYNSEVFVVKLNAYIVHNASYF